MGANDRLALMLSLLEMYDEYGVYSNYVRTIADNGSGQHQLGAHHRGEPSLRAGWASHLL